MYKFLQIFKRDFLNLLINPMWIFYSTVFPFLLAAIFGFLSSGNYGKEITSYDYYGISIIIYMILNTSTLAANSFMEEKIKKGNMRIIYSPLPKSNIYISKILATALFSCLCHFLVIALLNLTLNVNFGGGNIIYILLILGAFEGFVSILGVLFCIIFKSENTANQVLSIVINIFGILGGLFFRLDGFGERMEKLSYISPVKWLITNIFKVIYDRDFSYYMPTLYILILLSIIALLLCRIFYKEEDYIC